MKKTACVFLALLLAVACLPLSGLAESPALPYGNWFIEDNHEVLALLPSGNAIYFGSFGTELWSIKSCDSNVFVIEKPYHYSNESGVDRISWPYALSDDGATMTLRGYTYASYDENGNEKGSSTSNEICTATRLANLYGTWENTEEQITIELKEDGTAVPTVQGETGLTYLFYEDPQSFSTILLSEETGLPENMECFSFTLSEDGNTMTITGDNMTFYDENGKISEEEYHEINLVLTRK